MREEILHADFSWKGLTVHVLSAESYGRLFFIMRPKEEFLAKKTTMETLNEGDLVECLIKSIAPGIGILWEVLKFRTLFSSNQ